MATDDLIKAYSEYLDSLNIHVLRNVARRVGVYKPTDGKKESLIERTVSVLIGAVPPVPPSGRGAPLKDDSLDPKYMHRLTEIREEQTLKSGDDIVYRNITAVHSGDAPAAEFDRPLRTGILEIQPNGSGILRAKLCGSDGGRDTFVSSENIRAFALREGDYVVGTVSMRTENNVPVLEKVLSVNERSDYLTRGRFEEFTAVYPQEKIAFSAGNGSLFLRWIDLFSPIGKGQRVCLTVPPSVGAGAALREMIAPLRLHANRGENLHLLTLSVAAAPEEISEYEEALSDSPLSAPLDFAYTTFDMAPAAHLGAAKLLFSRAARLAEGGENVGLLLDSLTRLIEAADAVGAEEGGRLLPCGLHADAFRLPEQYFSMARNLRGGGSITVIAAVCLSERDERDSFIAREFGRFANCRISLASGPDGIFPDPDKSATVRAETLLSPAEAACIRALRESGREKESLQLLRDTADNAAFVGQFSE